MPKVKSKSITKKHQGNDENQEREKKIKQSNAIKLRENRYQSEFGKNKEWFAL